jgi:hypothetical protein
MRLRRAFRLFRKAFKGLRGVAPKRRARLAIPKSATFGQGRISDRDLDYLLTGLDAKKSGGVRFRSQYGGGGLRGSAFSADEKSEINQALSEITSTLHEEPHVKEHVQALREVNGTGGGG